MTESSMGFDKIFCIHENMKSSVKLLVRIRNRLNRVNRRRNQSVTCFAFEILLNYTTLCRNGKRF